VNDATNRVELLNDSHDTAVFSCGKPGLDDWLQRVAPGAARAGTAATYVALAHDQRVIGYYALVMASVTREGTPAALGRGMPSAIPVILLARLAISSDLHGQGLGGHLLVDALRRCVAGATAYGARAVIVDAIDDQAAAFYRHFGFRDLDPPRLWAKLADIRRSLEA
jgi:GNAT superfamily N-acetyltransferase